MGRVINEEARRRAGMDCELANKVNQRVLRLGHLESMNEQPMAKRECDYSK